MTKKLILALCLLVSFVSESFAGDDSKVVIRDNTGLVIGSTRSTNTGTVIVRDAYGRNVGSVDKDGRITDNYGRLKGFVREKDD